MPADRVLEIRVLGVLAMLKEWWQEREVYRAYWEGEKNRVVIFSLFLTPWERKLRRDKGMAFHIKAWLTSARDAGLDFLDLRLHEVDWHGLRDMDDADGVTGIGANTMATRTATTSSQERHASVARVVAAFDEVAFS